MNEYRHERTKLNSEADLSLPKDNARLFVILENFMADQRKVVEKAKSYSEAKSRGESPEKPKLIFPKVQLGLDIGKSLEDAKNNLKSIQSFFESIRGFEGIFSDEFLLGEYETLLHELDHFSMARQLHYTSSLFYTLEISCLFKNNTLGIKLLSQLTARCYLVPFDSEDHIRIILAPILLGSQNKQFLSSGDIEDLLKISRKAKDALSEDELQLLISWADKNHKELLLSWLRR